MLSGSFYENWISGLGLVVMFLYDEMLFLFPSRLSLDVNCGKG